MNFWSKKIWLENIFCQKSLYSKKKFCQKNFWSKDFCSQEKCFMDICLRETCRQSLIQEAKSVCHISDLQYLPVIMGTFLPLPLWEKGLTSIFPRTNVLWTYVSGTHVAIAYYSKLSPYAKFQTSSSFSSGNKTNTGQELRSWCSGLPS